MRPDATRRVAARWVTTHAVALAGAGLIAAQLGWTAILLAHSYFRQDDFVLLDRALRAGLGWSYLMSPDSGHLMPAGLAIIWVLARASLYNWLLAGAVIMLLVAAASAALLRVLLTLFGARPAILVLLTVYLFAPLSAGTVASLSAAVKILPLELALFMATDAHVRYLRAPRTAVRGCRRLPGCWPAWPAPTRARWSRRCSSRSPCASAWNRPAGGPTRRGRR